jgi:hypothetical protein
MDIREEYKLFFSWAGLRYDKEVASFTKAWLAGPVLSRAAQIQPNDYIELDFSRQNYDIPIFLPDTFFIARLRWKGVEYKDDKVVLKKCCLIHNKAGSLKDLRNGFKFIIDCSRHEEYMHRSVLVYPAWVMTPEDIIRK